jgi:hypothetical protein
MWYKIAAFNMAKVNEYMGIFQAESNPAFKYTELMEKVIPGSDDETALKEAFRAINNIPSNSGPSPKPNTTPAPNTTVKDLTLDKADKLERLRPNEGPSDLIVRPPGGELDLYKPKDEDDEPKKPSEDKKSCIIEEEVFIQNLLTGLTGYAQIYFKKKIFTISQDTYGGNRSPLAPLQSALGLTPPGRLDPNTQAYDPASSSIFAPSTRDFARPAGPLRDKNGRILKDPSGANLTVTAPVKDKTVVWNTADVQSIMSSLEKIAQMPELQKYGSKEITNILRYPLLQVKNEYEKIDEEKEKIDGEITSVKDKIDELDEKIVELEAKMRENHYEYQQIEILLNDPLQPKTPTERLSLETKKRKLYEDSSKLVPLELKYKQIISKHEENIVKLNSKKTKLDNIKPEVEVVPFKDFYKLTDLSRYYIYKGSQLNEVFCKLETQLIKTLNNTLNTLGKMEKNKRIQDIYKNARGK